MTTRNRIGLGNKNRICLQMDQGYAQITGDTNENDISGRHVHSPCKVLVELIRAYGVVQAGGSTVIRVYAGSTKAGTLVGTVTLTDSITTALMTLSNPGKVWPADQEFCLSEEGTAHTLDWLDVTICAREYEP
jgi:hypothetical protein